jgi:hypothetical protein
MKPTRKKYWMLAIAVAEALAIAAPLAAQIAAQDGRAMDANNRVGNGGFNQSRLPNQNVTPNQIIYGNVTGGRAFTGPIHERDSGAFLGQLPGSSTDRFIRTSSSAPLPYQPQFDLSTPVPFYGVSRGAPAPPGAVRVGFTGAYIGGETNQMATTSMNQYKMSTDWQAVPLGITTLPGTRTTLLGTRPDELVLEISQGTQNQELQVNGSPLYGIQSQPAGEANNPLDIYGIPSLLPGGSTDRFRVEQGELRRMRIELQNSAQPGEQQQLNQNSDLSQPLNPNNSNGSVSSALSSSNDLINPRSSASMQENPRRLNGPVPPELQSSQYAELRRRLAGIQNPVFAALQEAHDANAARRATAARAGGAASQPSAAIPKPPPGMIRQPGAAAMLNLPPVKINSLATGVRAKGLHDLLASAEDLMRQGKFQTAVDRYNMAQQVAPNNPLITIGRANAELGAGAYRQASSELHLAFVSDPATLMAQYDLAAWFPADRLNAIRQELQDLSAKDPKGEMPEFLLAYLAYNAGDKQEAARHLTEARKRSAGKDPSLQVMETAWKLSPEEKPAAPPADLNK